MRDRYKIINDAVERLATLTGDDFHGYRSEVWSTVSMAMAEGSLEQENAALNHLLTELCNDFLDVEEDGSFSGHRLAEKVNSLLGI